MTNTTRKAFYNKINTFNYAIKKTNSLNPNILLQKQRIDCYYSGESDKKEMDK
jgi:hypothetical protein